MVILDRADLAGLRIGDIAFMTIKGAEMHHGAVYIGNGDIFHHLADRLSRREPI